MTESPEIAFNVPSVEGQELEHMRAALMGGKTSSGGPFATRASDLLEQETGAADVLLTTSCTAALEMSALLLDIQPGYRRDPVRGVYNHGWVIGDETAMPIAVQSRIDALLEITAVEADPEPSS